MSLVEVDMMLISLTDFLSIPMKSSRRLSAIALLSLVSTGERKSGSFPADGRTQSRVLWA